MLNVVICDDNKRDLGKITKLIDVFMKKNKYDYKKHIYYNYNYEFMKLVKTKIPFRIYILDIETPSRSGIDVAREIRNRDLDSVIIFLTGHDELGRVILQNDLMFLAFVNKFDNLAKRLNEVMYKAMNLVKIKRVIRIEEGNNTYIINLNDILFLSKDTFDRKTTIKTDYTEYRVRTSLSQLKEMLDDRFLQSHRACIVNKTRIARIDYGKRIIYFDNNDYTDLLSNKYKKEMVIWVI